MPKKTNQELKKEWLKNRCPILKNLAKKITGTIGLEGWEPEAHFHCLMFKGNSSACFSLWIQLGTLGTNKINSKDKESVVVSIYSSRNPDSNSIIGPWIQDLFNSKKIPFKSFPPRAKDPEANKNEEGKVVYFEFRRVSALENSSPDLKNFQQTYTAIYEVFSEAQNKVSGTPPEPITFNHKEENKEKVEKYLTELLKKKSTLPDDHEPDIVQSVAPSNPAVLTDDHPRNLIYFGAPGTGKSHQLKVAVEGEEKEDGTITKDNDHGVFVTLNDAYKVDKRLYERVTFYPTYSYAQFVGCYKPVMEGLNIAYKFVPGPFLRVLVNALNEKPGEDGKKKNWCLVIEEINRANAAAVFGDVFQLLDRATKDSEDGSVKRGESEYEIAASEDVKKFLYEDKDGLTEAGKIKLEKLAGKGRLRIPSNMYIWATMNSADQGVFPMDTAFKRRWKFKYFAINQSDDKIGERKIGTNLKIDGKQVYDTAKWNDDMRNWNNVRKFVNRLLTLFKVNEDKLMGPWFVQPESGDEISAEQFESKVLMYLWEDAARMCRQKMFPNSVTSYSELITEWRKRGVGIFDHLMGDNQIGGKDKNTDNSATKLWSALDMPKQQQ